MQTIEFDEFVGEFQKYADFYCAVFECFYDLLKENNFSRVYGDDLTFVCNGIYCHGLTIKESDRNLLNEIEARIGTVIRSADPWHVEDWINSVIFDIIGNHEDWLEASRDNEN